MGIASFGGFRYYAKDKYYELRGSLVYSMPIPYERIIRDPRSFDTDWVAHFGPNGATGRPPACLSTPIPQPRVHWFVGQFGDMLEFDLDATVAFHKEQLETQIKQLFSKLVIPRPTGPLDL